MPNSYAQSMKAFQAIERELEQQRREEEERKKREEMARKMREEQAAMRQWNQPAQTPAPPSPAAPVPQTVHQQRLPTPPALQPSTQAPPPPDPYIDELVQMSRAPFMHNQQFQTIDAITAQQKEMANVMQQPRVDLQDPSQRAREDSLARDGGSLRELAQPIAKAALVDVPQTIGGVTESWGYAGIEGALKGVKHLYEYGLNPVASTAKTYKWFSDKFTLTKAEKDINSALGQLSAKQRPVDDIVRDIMSDDSVDRKELQRFQVLDWLNYVRQEHPDMTLNRRDILEYIRGHENYETNFDQKFDLSHPIFQKVFEAPEALDEVIDFYSKPEEHGLIFPELLKRREEDMKMITEKHGEAAGALLGGAHMGEDMMVMFITLRGVGAAKQPQGIGPGSAPAMPGAQPTYGGWAQKLADKAHTALRATGQTNPQQYQQLMAQYKRMIAHAGITTPGDLEERAMSAARRLAYNMTPIVVNATGATNLSAFTLDVLLNTLVDSPDTIELFMQEGGFTPAVYEHLITSTVLNIIMSRGTRGLIESQNMARYDQALTAYSKMEGLSKNEAHSKIQSTNRILRDTGQWERAEEHGPVGPSNSYWQMTQALKGFFDDETGAMGPRQHDKAKINNKDYFINRLDGVYSTDNRFKVKQQADGTHSVFDRDILVAKGFKNPDKAKDWTVKAVHTELDTGEYKPMVRPEAKEVSAFPSEKQLDREKLYEVVETRMKDYNKLQNPTAASAKKILTDLGPSLERAGIDVKAANKLLEEYENIVKKKDTYKGKGSKKRFTDDKNAALTKVFSEIDRITSKSVVLGQEQALKDMIKAQLVKADEDAKPEAKEEVRPGTKVKAEDLPDSVQRYEEPGVKVDTAKPQGLYTTPADRESPHSDLGGERVVYQVNKNANVLYAKHDDNEVVMRRGAIGAGAGVHAARELLGETEFARLQNMLKSDLVAEASKMFPGVDFSKYNDAQEVMEAIGGRLAAQKGYDAIYHPYDRDPNFTEYVALTDKAFASTDKEPVKPQVEKEEVKPDRKAKTAQVEAQLTEKDFKLLQSAQKKQAEGKKLTKAELAAIERAIALYDVAPKPEVTPEVKPQVKKEKPKAMSTPERIDDAISKLSSKSLDIRDDAEKQLITLARRLNTVPKKERNAEYQDMRTKVEQALEKQFMPPKEQLNDVIEKFTNQLSAMADKDLKYVRGEMSNISKGSDMAYRLPYHKDLKKKADLEFSKRFMPFRQLDEKQNEEIIGYAIQIKEMTQDKRHARAFEDYEKSPNKANYIANTLERPDIMLATHDEVKAAMQKYNVTSEVAKNILMEKYKEDGVMKELFISADARALDALREMQGLDLANPTRATAKGIKDMSYNDLVTGYQAALEFARLIRSEELRDYQKNYSKFLGELEKHRPAISDEDITADLRRRGIDTVYDSKGEIKTEFLKELQDLEKRYQLMGIDDAIKIWEDKQRYDTQLLLTDKVGKTVSPETLKSGLKDWFYFQNTSLGRLALNVSRDNINADKVADYGLHMIDQKNMKTLLTKHDNNRDLALKEFKDMFGRAPKEDTVVSMLYQKTFLAADNAAREGAGLKNNAIIESRERFERDYDLLHHFRTTAGKHVTKEEFQLSSDSSRLDISRTVRTATGPANKVTMGVDEMVTLYMHVKGDIIRDERTGEFKLNPDLEKTSTGWNRITDAGVRLESDTQRAHFFHERDLLAIINRLDEKYQNVREFADWMFSKYNGEFKDFVNEHTAKYAGFGLAQRDNYVPQELHESDRDAKRVTKSHAAALRDQSYEVLSLLQGRVEDSKRPLYVGDAMQTFSRYMNHASNIPMIKVMYDYERLVKTGRVQREARALGLTEHLDAIDKLMRNVATFSVKEYDDSFATRSLGAIRRNWTKTRLSANPWIAGLQLNSFAYAAAELPMKNWGSFNSREAYKEMLEYSPVNGFQRYEMRYIDRDLIRGIGDKRAAYELAGKYQNTADQLFQPRLMLFADSKVLTFAWNSTKNMIKDRHAELSKDEQLRLTGVIFDWLVAYSQPSAMPHTRGLMSQSDSEIHKFMTMFFSQRQKIKDEIIHAPMDWANAESNEERALALKRFITYAIIGTLGKEIRDRAMGSARDRPQDDFLSSTTFWNSVETLSSTVPYAGQLISNARYAMGNQNMQSGLELPALQVGNDLINSLSLVIKGIDEYINDPYYAGQMSFAEKQKLMADHGLTEEEAIAFWQGEQVNKAYKTWQRAIPGLLNVFDAATGIPTSNYLRNTRDLFKSQSILGTGVTIDGYDGMFFFMNFGRKPSPSHSYDSYFNHLKAGDPQSAGHHMVLLTGPEFYNRDLTQIQSQFERFAEKEGLSDEKAKHYWEQTLDIYKIAANYHGLPTDAEIIDDYLNPAKTRAAREDFFNSFRSDEGNWKSRMAQAYKEAEAEGIDTSSWNSDFYDLLRHGITTDNRALVNDATYVLTDIVGRDRTDLLRNVQQASDRDPELANALDRQAFGYHHNYPNKMKGVIEDALYEGRYNSWIGDFKAYRAEQMKLDPDFETQKIRVYAPLWENWHNEQKATEAMKWLILTEFYNPLFVDRNKLASQGEISRDAFDKLYRPSSPRKETLYDTARRFFDVDDLTAQQKEKLDRIWFKALEELTTAEAFFDNGKLWWTE